MLRIGATDAFEREYTQKFRVFAGQFGEFVVYERDRGARDIGLHLTRKLRSGSERLSSTLCWFQLKGLRKSTLSKEDFWNTNLVKLSLKVRHLKYWYLQPMPTYLVLFVESVDTFLILNLQEYVEQRWGRGVLNLKCDEAGVGVPRSSILDETAFQQILAESDVKEWARALGERTDQLRLCRRDYDLIWHIGTGKKRKVKHRLQIIDWQSKLRGEVHVEESPEETDDWHELRNHWQLMLGAPGVEGMYPYLELYSLDEEDWLWDDEPWVPDLKLANGGVVNPLRQVIVNTHSPAVVAQIPDESLLIADLKMVERDGQWSKSLALSCLPDTWRSVSGETDVVRKGELLAYLNPFPRQKTLADFPYSPVQGRHQMRRVIDRRDMQLALGFELDGE